VTARRLVQHGWGSASARCAAIGKRSSRSNLGSGRLGDGRLGIQSFHFASASASSQALLRPSVRIVTKRNRHLFRWAMGGHACSHRHTRVLVGTKVLAGVGDDRFSRRQKILDAIKCDVPRSNRDNCFSGCSDGRSERSASAALGRTSLDKSTGYKNPNEAMRAALGKPPITLVWRKSAQSLEPSRKHLPPCAKIVLLSLVVFCIAALL
jgi:hypothetical protein